jgi:hypothetical protein
LSQLLNLEYQVAQGDLASFCNHVTRTFACI